MTYLEFKELSGMKNIEIAEKFKIPYQTTRNWSCGFSNPPEYVVDFMEFRLSHKKKIEIEGIGCRELRSMIGLSQQKMSDRYNIPKRTISNWELGESNCPDYVAELLEYRVKYDLMSL